MCFGARNRIGTWRAADAARHSRRQHVLELSRSAARLLAPDGTAACQSHGDGAGKLACARFYSWVCGSLRVEWSNSRTRATGRTQPHSRSRSSRGFKLRTRSPVGTPGTHDISDRRRKTRSCWVWASLSWRFSRRGTPKWSRLPLRESRPGAQGPFNSSVSDLRSDTVSTTSSSVSATQRV